MMKTLDHLNFGTGIKRWVNIFYTNIGSAVQNNGFIASWFKPSKVVRQGCPLSPYFFIISAEVLLNKIRQKSNVRGITVFGMEIKLSQFADDGLENCWGFRKNCWFVPECEKTKALWLGKWKNNRNKPPDLKWFHSPVKILGI